jgi:hypothetical protein
LFRDEAFDFVWFENVGEIQPFENFSYDAGGVADVEDSEVFIVFHSEFINVFFQDFEEDGVEGSDSFEVLGT